MSMYKSSFTLHLCAVLLVFFAGVTVSAGADDSWNKVVEFQTKMAENGSVSAQFILGEMYQEGRGVKQNYKISLEWFQKAESNGHKQAPKRVTEVKGLIANPPKKQKAVVSKPQPKAKPRKKAQATVLPKPKAKPKPKSRPQQKAKSQSKPKPKQTTVAKKRPAKPQQKVKLQRKAKPKQTTIVTKPVSKKTPAKPVAAKPTQTSIKNKTVPKQKVVAKKPAQPRKPVDTTLMDAIGGFDDEEDAEVVTLEE